MKLIVGLGNPGKQYERTRHNAGFMAVDEIARRCEVSFSQKKFNAELATLDKKGEKVILMKPQTFMNLSGEAVMACANFYKIGPEDILVLHDDLDLPVGKIRIRQNGSAGGQKGMKNIIDLLHTQNIARIRIGIDKNPLIPVVDYVLGKIPAEQKETFDASIEQAAKAAEMFMTQRIDLVMNRYNKK